jgi:hypothetical protein
MDEDDDCVCYVCFYLLIRYLGQGLRVALPTKMFSLEAKKFHAEISSSQENS